MMYFLSLMSSKIGIMKRTYAMKAKVKQGVCKI